MKLCRIVHKTIEVHVVPLQFYVKAEQWLSQICMSGHLNGKMIGKGSPGGALYLGICIRNYGSCDGIPYIL